MAAALVDLARVLWLVTLVTLAIWAPAAIVTRRRLPPLAALLEQTVLVMAIATVAVSTLSPARLLNPTTLSAAFLLWPVGCWIAAHRQTLAPDLLAAARRLALGIAITLESGAGWTAARDWVARGWLLRGRPRVDADALSSPAAVLVLVALAITVAPGLVAAVSNVRLPSAAAYEELLLVQRLLVGDAGWHRPSPAADVTTALSVFSAIAPVHVVRLSLPIAAGVVLLTLAAVLRMLTGSAIATVSGVVTAALISAGATTLSGQAGAAMLLITIVLAHPALARGRNVGAAVAAALLLALSAPSLGIVAAAATAATLLRPSATLLTAGLSWVWVAAMTQSGDRYGWALVAAAVVHAADRRFTFARPPVKTVFATALAMLALSVVMPRAVAAHYIEYDAAARQTLRIASDFPAYKWMIVGPVEQWSLSYGRGWHMNLHEFVEQLGARVDDADLELPFTAEDVFVFVEKRPFALYAAEPADVPFSALIDPVYRHYRSPAGRASLQFAASRLCERLLERTPGSIHYEDSRLKIYRFTRH
jgi:hypothetical protein